MKSYCCNTVNVAICQMYLSRCAYNLTEDIMEIKVAMDLKGIHFFDITGEVHIITWLWSTITNMKVHRGPMMLVMFDILVQEIDYKFLRTIVIQTPFREYLFSVAECILMIHRIKPEVMRGSSSFQYTQQFKTTENPNKPYSLLYCKSTAKPFTE